MAQQKRHGFTLIELLVVTIIIGILAALITPAIMAAVRRSKEFTIQSEMKQIETALEKFKNEYGVYPVDFGNPYVLNDFIRQIAPNHAYGAIVDDTDPSTIEDDRFWYAAELAGGRRPQTIDRAEALVLWLGGVSTNPEYPLGVLRDFSVDRNYQPKRFFEFDETRLKDLDNDGWPEYYPPSGPQNPYVYFDARTLRATNVPNADPDDVADVINQSVYPQNYSPELISGQHGDLPSIPSANRPIAAYLNANATAFINATNEKQSYQLICAGLDGEYGADLSLTDGYDFTSGNTSLRLVTGTDDSSPDLNLPAFRSHRDNITNLKDGSRLDIHN